MWFFGSDSFLSVVQHKKDPAILVVRARRPGHIEKMFPTANVVTLDGRDYQFRADLPREVVAARMAQYVMEMSATNFKDSVKEPAYHNACYGVWNCMEAIQPKPAYSRYSGNQRLSHHLRGPQLSLSDFIPDATPRKRHQKRG
ncbi:hypothetical protein KS527_004648 [Salmonella enterica]|nr:hypothetical protein [Salmonella enterica]